MKIFITVKVGAKQEKIKKIDESRFEIWVREKPIQGKANEKIAKILSECFKVPLSEIKIISGLKSKNKILTIG